MKTAVISVHQVSKKFSCYSSFRPRTIMEAVLAFGRRMRAVETVWALRHVSFTVSPGEMLGILGHNGAGKSTLLRLIGEVGRPDQGKVLTRGRLGTLLELGAGFHPDLTGIENIYVTAAICGLTERQTRRKLREIIDFAELHDFIEQPLRTYSTGMQMRLAFAIAIHTEPDILLVDEVLAVGDISFQSKCIKRIKALKDQGCAVILVSHSPEQIQQLCDTALWLDKGQVRAYGSPKIVAGQYTSSMRTQTFQRTPYNTSIRTTDDGVDLVLHKNRFGSLEAEITRVKLLPNSEITSGNSLITEVQYKISQEIQTVALVLTITDSSGKSYLNKSTDLINVKQLTDDETHQTDIYIDKVNLAPGQYYVDIGIYEKNWSYAYDYHWNVYSLNVVGSSSPALVSTL